jgi:putative PIN family toxin of toxin-antitoxin system
VADKISVVLDTNILISSFFGGNPARIIELFLSEDINLYYSTEIFHEYRDVLFREKFSQISESKRRIILEAIFELGILVIPNQKVSIITEDPADNKFLECADYAKVDFLVTGNTHHFNFSTFNNVRIVNPNVFLEEWEKRG